MIRFYFSRLHWYITFNTFRCSIDTIMTKEMPTIYEPYGRYWFESTVYKKIMIIIFYLHTRDIHTHSEGGKGNGGEKRKEGEGERETSVSKMLAEYRQTDNRHLIRKYQQIDYYEFFQVVVFRPPFCFKKL